MTLVCKANPRRWSVLGAVLFAAAGCGWQPSGVSAPNVNPATAAKEAISEFDTTGDGALSRDELAACPGLLSVFDAYNTDGNDGLSAGEIEAGINRWAGGKMGLTQITCKVLSGGRPVPQATVRFVPEPFLTAALSPGEGTTNAQGLAGLGATDKSFLPKNLSHMKLMQPGIYRVEISHASAKIPAKFNTDTTLGVEITAEHPGPSPLVWNIDTK